MKFPTLALASLLLLGGPCAGLAESEVCGASAGASEACKSPVLVQVKSPLATGSSTHGLAKLSDAPVVKLGSANENTCPTGFSRIVDEATCRAAMPFLERGDPDDFNGVSREADWPRGCYSCSRSPGCTDGIWFNPHESGGQQRGAFPVCAGGFAIEKGTTLFVGDSDVDYWHTFRVAVPDAFNVGIGGNTCNDAFNEIDGLLAAFEPAWVVLVCGENDLAGGASGSTTFRRWVRVVRKILAAGARVVMMGTKPEAATTNLHGKYQAYDAKIKQYALDLAGRTTPAPVIFNDVFGAFTAMGNPDSLYDPSETPDYLHMGRPGYARWNAWVQVAQAGLLDCVVWMGGACKARVPSAPSIDVVQATTNECPAGSEKLATKEQCHAASGFVNGELEFQGTEEEAGWPAGCYQCEEGVDGCLAGTWFNEHGTGAAKVGAHLLCIPTQGGRGGRR